MTIYIWSANFHTRHAGNEFGTNMIHLEPYLWVEDDLKTLIDKVRELCIKFVTDYTDEKYIEEHSPGPPTTLIMNSHVRTVTIDLTTYENHQHMHTIRLFKLKDCRELMLAKFGVAKYARFKEIYEGE